MPSIKGNSANSDKGTVSFAASSITHKPTRLKHRRFFNTQYFQCVFNHMQVRISLCIEPQDEPQDEAMLLRPETVLE